MTLYNKTVLRTRLHPYVPIDVRDIQSKLFISSYTIEEIGKCIGQREFSTEIKLNRKSIVKRRTIFNSITLNVIVDFTNKYNT